MHRTEVRVTVVAALLAVSAALFPAVASAGHDPTPPYVSTSKPGDLELYGFHHKQLSATVHVWAGLQRCPGGTYRPWIKAQGDGRQLSLLVSNLYFVEGANVAGPGSGTRGPGRTVYYTGLCRPVQDLAQIMGSVKARYSSGSSTGRYPECLESFTIRRGQRAAYSAPRRGC